MDFAIEWLRECFGILSRVLGSDVVAYIANLLSAVISGGVIYGFIFKRKEMGAVLAALVGAYIERRVQKVRETIRELDKLNWNAKRDRKEINALFGQLCGQISGLVREVPALADLSRRIHRLHLDPDILSEAEKRRIVNELEGELDRLGRPEA